MFEDYYFDDPDMQQAIADALAQYYQPAPAAQQYVEPYQYTPAPQPMTVEAEPIMGIGSPAVYEAAAPAAAPYDISGLGGLDLSGLGGLNFSGFGGGRMGGVIEDPNIQYIPAPVSNKGNPTGKMGGNVFTVTPEQPVRLVDHRTNQVVFEGSGFDAARTATELGQSLTDSLGRKANYSIQTADPTGSYNTVAYEKKNKSTLGTIASVAGTVLPLAMIPLTMGMSAPLAGLSTAGKIALGAGLGGLGSGLKGDNILKGAAMGGLSAAGGQLLGAPLGKVGDIGLRAGTAIGTGLGSTAGGLVTGQSLKNSLLGGVASGALSYMSPDIVKGLGINQGAPVSTGGDINADLVPNALEGLSFGPLASASIPAGVGASIPAGIGGDISVIGRSLTPSFSTSNINLGGFKTPAQRYLDDAANTEVSNPLTGTDYASGYDGDIINVTGSVPGAVTGGLNLGDLSPEILDGMKEFAKNPIVAEGSKIERPTSISAPVTGALDTDIVVNAPKAVSKEDGLPEGSVVAGLPIMGLPKMDPNLTEKSTLEKIKDAANIANAVSVLVPLAGGLLGGGGGGGTMAPDTSGLNFTKSPLRPTIPGGAGGIGGIGGRYPYTPTTYGRTGGDQETEYLFFTRDPETGATTAIPAPPATGPGGQGGPLAKKEGGEIEDDMVKHLVDYHKNGGHQGPGQVKGIGSGQEDKIPAWLSDGEYVWSAQDVSDLGDGSNKEGVRRLDKMRQMVRRQAGRKDVKKIAKPQKGIDTMLKAVGGMV